MRTWLAILVGSVAMGVFMATRDAVAGIWPRALLASCAGVALTLVLLTMQRRKSRP